LILKISLFQGVAESVDESLALALNSHHTEHANDANGDRDDNPRVKRSRVFRLARRALSSVSDVSTHHQPSMALDAAVDSSNSNTTRSSRQKKMSLLNK
jgi:hypothetical protein